MIAVHYAPTMVVGSAPFPGCSILGLKALKLKIVWFYALDLPGFSALPTFKALSDCEGPSFSEHCLCTIPHPFPVLNPPYTAHYLLAKILCDSDFLYEYFLKALSENGEHIDAALTDLKSKWQIVHDAQFQLTMKQLTIDNEKDALANKIARIDSQVN